MSLLKNYKTTVIIICLLVLVLWPISCSDKLTLVALGQADLEKT